MEPRPMWWECLIRSLQGLNTLVLFFLNYWRIASICLLFHWSHLCHCWRSLKEVKQRCLPLISSWTGDVTFPLDVQWLVSKLVVVHTDTVLKVQCDVFPVNKPRQTEFNVKHYWVVAAAPQWCESLAVATFVCLLTQSCLCDLQLPKFSNVPSTICILPLQNYTCWPTGLSFNTNKYQQLFAMNGPKFTSHL